MSERKQRHATAPQARKIQPANLSAPFWLSCLKAGAALFVLIILALILYSNTFQSSFHFDDELHIVNNPTIRQLGDFQALWHYRMRLVTYFTLALNYHFGKLGVEGYHLVNILIHAASAFAAGWLALLTLRTPRLKGNPLVWHARTFAVCTALIFLAHPVQTQAVTYLIQRAASLATFFYLLTLALYAKSRLEGRPLYLVPALLSAFAAVFSKENAYTLPFAILAYDLMFWGRKGNLLKRFLGMAVFLLPLGVAYALLYGNQESLQAVTQSLGHEKPVTPLQYLLTQFSVLRTYLRLLLFPVEQNLDYDYPLSTGLFEPRTALSLIFLLGLLGDGIRMIRNQPLIAFGILWFFLTLSIESSVIPIADVIFEHRLYLAMYGFATAFLAALFLFVNRETRDFKIAATVLLGVLCVMTWQRNEVWQNEVTLWEDALKKAPRNIRAHVNLGNAYQRQGRLQDAGKLYQKALELQPDYDGAYNALGALEHSRGRYEDAVNYYKKALAITPDYIDVYYNLGLAQAKLGDHTAAIESYKEAIRRRPRDANPYSDLGIAYSRTGDFEKSIEILKKGIELSPGSPTPVKNLAVAYIKKGDTEKAQEQAEALRKMGAGGLAEEIEAALKTGIENPAMTSTVTRYENGKIVSVEPGK